MQLMLGMMDSVLVVLRGSLLAVAVVLAGCCGVDWLVRTRRVSPFGPVARFMRSSFDPLIRPVERRVVRAGGSPANAPWWALAFVVLAGIVLISLLDFLRGQLAFFFRALDGGPRGVYHLAVSWTFAVLQLALIVRVVLSWIVARPGAWYVRWSFRLSEPILRPLRQYIPTIGGIDITPIVAWLVLQLVEGMLLRLA